MLTATAVAGAFVLVLNAVVAAAHQLGYAVPVLTQVAQWVATVKTGDAGATPPAAK